VLICVCTTDNLLILPLSEWYYVLAAVIPNTIVGVAIKIKYRI
jgi:hypothetical protein